MIRSSLPIPFLYRLRLNAGAAAQRAVGTPHAARQAARRPAARTAGQLWQEFIDRYEAFTGVLCAAAKSGCDTGKESEYSQLRRWFVANYYRVAPRLRPALEEALQGQEVPTAVIADYAGQKRTLDPMEALFMPPTLGEVLRQDSGDLLPRIARISEAVYRCFDEWTSANES